MPKLPATGGYELTIKKKDDKNVIKVLTLPMFCVEHMQKMDSKANLDLMIKHINSGIKPEKAQSLYSNGVKLEKLEWQECCKNCEFEIS
jgi:hypothetical protein